MSIKLYSYWRSSAAYRVRIALQLKGLDHEIVPVSLAPGVSEHREEAYREKNPQMLVPFFEDGDVAIGQSMSILEYLEEAYPAVPLLPLERHARAPVRAFCNSICCDIHPLNNLRVLTYLSEQFGATESQRFDWYANWVIEGFRSAEQFAIENSRDGAYVVGNRATLADACLVPQVYNARRFDVPLDAFPTLVSITNNCNEDAAFQAAAPEMQPDAVAQKD